MYRTEKQGKTCEAVRRENRVASRNRLKNRKKEVIVKVQWKRQPLREQCRQTTELFVPNFAKTCKGRVSKRKV
jgi:hypothetical protein